MSCNTTKALYLTANVNEDHRLVISQGKEIGGIEISVTSSATRSWRFLQVSSNINNTLENGTNTTEYRNITSCLSGTLPNIIPSECKNNREFNISSTHMSGTIPS
eukprot:PhF_6_TR5875/c0_g1_i1/m.8553